MRAQARARPGAADGGGARVPDPLQPAAAAGAGDPGPALGARPRRDRSPAANHGGRAAGAGEPGRDGRPTWSGRPIPAVLPPCRSSTTRAQCCAGASTACIESLSGVSFAGLGVAGFLLFVYGATSLMRTVENSFNILYQADDPPPWSRLALYFTLLTLGPFALAGAQVLQDRLLENLDTFMGGWLAAPFAYVAPLLASCVVLVLAFRTIPNTWVAWRAAVIGGLWSGVAWFAFQEIFGYYVNHVGMISLYGALALIPLFLLWIYWSWLIILAGLALSFIVQYLPADEHWARRPLLPSDPRLLVPIMVRIADAFERGEKITTARLSLELGVPPRILRPYVRVLEGAEYVRGLRDRADQHVLTLARPADTIKVRQILELAPPARTPVAAELLEELRRRELGAVGDLTLEQLVARSSVRQRRATSAGAGRGGGRAPPRTRRRRGLIATPAPSLGRRPSADSALLHWAVLPTRLSPLAAAAVPRCSPCVLALGCAESPPRATERPAASARGRRERGADHPSLDAGAGAAHSLRRRDGRARPRQRRRRASARLSLRRSARGRARARRTVAVVGAAVRDRRHLRRGSLHLVVHRARPPRIDVARVQGGLRRGRRRPARRGRASIAPSWCSSATASRRRSIAGTTTRAWTCAARSWSCSTTIPIGIPSCSTARPGSTTVAGPTSTRAPPRRARPERS